MSVYEIWERILDLFFPPRCPFCRAILRDYEKTLCGKCRRSLPWVPDAAQCQSFRHIDRCLSPLYYSGDVRSSLLRYKFGALSVYARPYGAILTDCLRNNEVACDVITWVPISAKRLRKRGYDQAKLLAEEIARQLGIPCRCLLIKTADNPPQSVTGSAEKRKKNVAGVYRPADLSQIKGKSILLVDDIVTTGATLSECARVLKVAGAKKITAASVARSER